MTRQLLVLALSAIVGASATALAQQPAPATPRPSPLAGDLVRLFPERTALYVEIPHLGTFVDVAGDREALLTSLNDFLGDTGTRADALKPAELGAMLDASAAAGLISADPNPNLFMLLGATPNVVVLRMASDEGLAVLRDRVIARYAAAGEAAPRTETVRGLVVTHLPKLSYAVDGRTVLAGEPHAVLTILETTGTDGKRVGDDPGYNSAVSKHASGRDALFGYIGGRTISGTFANMFGSSVPAGTPKSKEVDKVDKARRVEEEALRNFLGVEAVQGLAVSVAADGEGAVVRYDFEIDRTRAGLAATITDPPMVSFRAASLLPADVEQVQLASIDAMRIYDLLERHFGPLPERAGGMSFASLVAQAESMVGMSLRRELLPALGNEFGYAFNIDALVPMPPPPGERPDGKPDDEAGIGISASTELSAGPPPVPLVLAEVRDREVVRRAVVSIVAKLVPGVPAELTAPVEYMGFEIWKGPGVSIGLGTDFLVVGSEARVRDCVDAKESGKTLATVPDYELEAARWAGAAIYATYQSPKYQEKLRDLTKRYREIAKAGGADDEESDLDPTASNLDPFSDITTTPIFRDATGVHWESRAQAAGLRATFATFVKTTLVSGPRSKRRRESESAAIALLQEIVVHEKAYRAKAGRFGTLEDMAAAGVVGPDVLERIAKKEDGYDVRVVLTAEGYHATATPVEYGRWGRRSFFVDETAGLRGADKKGDPAGAGDDELAPYERDVEP
jgi:hypothetical protein